MTVGDGVPVPNATWKVVVFLEKGQTLSDVTAATKVVSIIVPNNDLEVGANQSFEHFLSTPQEIETRTGLQFFNTLPKALADSLRGARYEMNKPN